MRSHINQRSRPAAAEEGARQITQRFFPKGILLRRFSSVSLPLPAALRTHAIHRPGSLTVARAQDSGGARNKLQA